MLSAEAVDTLTTDFGDGALLSEFEQVARDIVSGHSACDDPDMLLELGGVDEVGGSSIIPSGHHRRGLLRGLDDRSRIEEEVIGPEGPFVARVRGSQMLVQLCRHVILDAGEAGSGGGHEVGGGDQVEHELRRGADGRDVAETLNGGEEHGGRRYEGSRREYARRGWEQQPPVAAYALQNELE